MARGRSTPRLLATISALPGYDHQVALVGINSRQVKTLAESIAENREAADRGKVEYLAAEAFPDYLESLGPGISERTVRGYKVRTVQQMLGPADAHLRRRAVADVLARSLKDSKTA